MIAQRQSTTALEDQFLQELALDAPWSLIERFTSLVRESGSEEEREAAQYIAEQLDKFGVPYEVYDPEIYLSVPISASLVYEGKTVRAKPPAFSRPPGPQGLTGEAVYVPSTRPSSASNLFDSGGDIDIDVSGKIVVTEGLGLPAAVARFEAAGAIGQIHINPGVDIHWGICTTIWGAPDLDNAASQPKTTVISINRPDGEALIERLKHEPLEVTLYAELREGWFPCPIVVADIRGQLEPDRYVLVHGHYDSWDVGIGDNAVGDATLLELARVFHKKREHLARGLRVAWWPGHSTGRYGGSTWYADNFGLDLARNCIAQVDIDSPGCRWATEYYDISWMTETEDFCVETIFDATGKAASGERPHQAGDYSFNNIGLTGFYMLLSSMPRELIAEKGYYPTGGCGGNIAWHTENDQLEIADEENLMRDLRVYVLSLLRIINRPVHPFDFRRLAAEFAETLAKYGSAARGVVDFRDATQALAELQDELDAFYTTLASLQDRAVTDPAVRTVNDAILNLGRTLVPIHFTRHGRFRTEPALPIAPLPDLQPAMVLPHVQDHERRVVATHVRRGLNRVAWTFQEATESVRSARQKL
jgi:hypothetical protein